MVNLNDSLHREKSLQKRFRQLQIAFVQYLGAAFPDTAKYGFIHSTPFLIDPKDEKEFKSAYETLTNVSKRLIVSYEKDSDIQKAIPLSKKARSLLEACENPFNLGTLRADFLISENGNFFINEVNARFPTNGYFISHGVNQALSQMRTYCNLGISGLKGLENIPSYFSKLTGKVTVLKDTEPNWDIDLFKQFLLSENRSLEYLTPSSIKNRNGRLTSNGKELESVVIELKQHEIYRYLSPSFVSAIQKYPHTNDLRTILIGHDKRLFELLTDNNILQRYASKEERKILNAHLPKTHSINHPSDLSEIRDEKDKWVLKPALSGKGDSVYLGTKSSEEKWAEGCSLASKGNFVAQRYIKQKEYSVYFPHLNEYPCEAEGMLLGIDGKYISQGLYRAKYTDPTRLAEGFVFIPPAAT